MKTDVQVLCLKGNTHETLVSFCICFVSFPKRATNNRALLRKICIFNMHETLKSDVYVTWKVTYMFCVALCNTVIYIKSDVYVTWKVTYIKSDVYVTLKVTYMFCVALCNTVTYMTRLSQSATLLYTSYVLILLYTSYVLMQIFHVYMKILHYDIFIIINIYMKSILV